MTDPVTIAKGLTSCRTCGGDGCVGPVHINYGGGRGEWRDTVPCYDCDGTGRWTHERLSAHDAGQELRRRRIARGETIRDAAARLGVGCASISRMERGARPYTAEALKEMQDAR